MYMLDKNILIHYVRNNALSQRIENTFNIMTSENVALISIVTVGEIRALAEELSCGMGKRRAMTDLLDYYTVIPIPFASIVDNYVEASEYCRRRGRTLGKNDLWIAATAMTTGATLLTTDRDFDHFAPPLLSHQWIDPTV